VTRAQLLDDALNLALSGRLEYRIALDLTSQLITDVEYLPWSAALTALEHLDTMLALTPAYGNFKVCETEVGSNRLTRFSAVYFSCTSTDTSIYFQTVLNELRIPCLYF
jgi:hypothetical protein